MATKHLRDMIQHWHERGYATTEIAQILHLPEPEVSDIILGRDQKPIQATRPEFIEPHLFDDQEPHHA